VGGRRRNSQKQIKSESCTKHQTKLLYVPSFPSECSIHRPPHISTIPTPSRILLAPFTPSSAKNFLYAPLNNLSISDVQVSALCSPWGILSRDSARVGTLGRKNPLQGKTSFFFRVRRREDYISPKGKVFSPCGFALPKKLTILPALRALRASLIISVRARGRGESV
jgi:hypothetical protein